MSFILQKTSDHGCTNPIVARLIVQSRQFLECFFIGQEKKDKILLILHKQIQSELLNCFDIWTNLKKTEVYMLNKIDAQGGLQTQSNDRIVSVDAIPKLEDSAKTFLISAHASLRDLIQILFTLYPEEDKLQKASNYKDVKKWAKRIFGEEDDLYVLLENEFNLWLSKLWDKRNAISHPNGYSGTLTISNFSAHKEPNNSKWSLIPPIWHHNADHPSSITDDMKIYIFNILEFVEELLIHCLQKQHSAIPIAFYEIKDADRDQDCPVKFVAQPEINN